MVRVAATILLALSVLGGSVAHARVVTIGSLDAPIDLAGVWKFQPGDDPGWGAPQLDDSEWDRLIVPRGWGSQGYPELRGIAWYRLDIDLSPVLDANGREDLRIGLRVGDVTSSYELYAGGTRIGGVGELPPRPRMEYDRHRVYAIPLASVGADGRLVIALRVWKSSISRVHEGGPNRGDLSIGRLESLRERELLRRMPYLALALIFAAVALYHIRLYVEHRALAEHLWFGLFTLDIAVLTFLQTQWKYTLTDDFVLLKNLEYISTYVLPALGLQLVSSIFSRSMSRLLRAYQLSHVALALVVGLTPDLRLNLITISYWQLWVLPTLVYAAVVGWQEYRRGHAEAKIFASLFFLATCVFDIVVDQGWLRGPAMIPVGLVVMIFSMATSLANRLIHAHGELESLTENLEARVGEQTAQLRERTEQLEQKNRELEDVQGSLREASLTDPLTGLKNRRFLSEHLEFDVARVLREYARADADPSILWHSQTDLVFLLIDLDHFKEVNDYNGHAAGDRILQEVASILNDVCRASDFVVRWGGEEFLVVGRFVDWRGAATLAARICEGVRSREFVVEDGARLRQTCSIGFAALPFLPDDPDEFSWQQVVSVADRALYMVKEGGRDGWMGVRGLAGSQRTDLARRVREDFSGCLSRGEVECQASGDGDAGDDAEPEKDESPPSQDAG